jgi:hypothetical protein
MPIINPNTGRDSRTFNFKGRIDLVTDRRLVDWKTVSDAAMFIQQHTIGFQPELYTLALRYAGIHIDLVEYRLITKPMIKLCGKDANREAYENRCVEWLRSTEGALLVHEVWITPPRMERAQAWLWSVAKRLMECRNCKRWLTNEYACYTFNRSCEFLPLCMLASMGADVEDTIREKYEQKPRHEEIASDGLDVITYSSATTLAICEQRYQYRYERGLRRREEETSTALYTGSALHIGMEAFICVGLEAAMKVINEWETQNPILGSDAAKKQDQQIAQARAMMRVAAEKWPLYDSLVDANREG